jgi:hypothetical protein
MWFSDLIVRSWEYASAYFRILRKAGIQLLLANMTTRSQLGRFYWVCWLMTAAAIWTLFWSSNLVFGGQHPTEQDLRACYPKKDLSVLACLVLAEFASFILLIGAVLESKLIVRIWPPPASVAAGHDARVITRRLHGLMWGWFPIFLFLVATISRNYWLNDLQTDCSLARPIGVALVAEHIWPGFIAAYAIVVAINYFIYKWTKSLEMAFIIACTFVLYAVVTAIVSPADVILLVQFCQNLPAKLQSGWSYFVGLASG